MFVGQEVSTALLRYRMTKGWAEQFPVPAGNRLLGLRLGIVLWSRLGDFYYPFKILELLSQISLILTTCPVTPVVASGPQTCFCN